MNGQTPRKAATAEGSRVVDRRFASQPSHDETATDEQANPSTASSAIAGYWKDVQRVPRLTPQEEIALASEIAFARHHVRELLSNMPVAADFVVDVVRRVRGGSGDCREIVSYRTSREGDGYYECRRVLLACGDALEDVAALEHGGGVSAEAAAEARRELIREARLSEKALSTLADSLAAAAAVVRRLRRLRRQAGTLGRVDATELDSLLAQSAALRPGEPRADAVVAKLRSVVGSRKTSRLVAAHEAVCTAERTHGLSAAAIVELDRCVTRERHRIETAKHRFIEANLRLVLSIARRYHARGFDFLDLVQEGNIGLMRAVDRFDHRYGFRFSSYAVRVICQSVRSAIHARGSLVRLPAQLSDRLPEVTAATRRLRHALEREPDAQEVADAACVPVECVRELETCMDQPVSLDARIADDDDSTLVAYLPDSDAIDLVDAVCDLDVNQRIEAALEELGEREQRILRMRFGLGTAASLDHSLEQVGRCFGISRERIRQVEGAALRKLRAQATRRGRRQKRKG